VNGTGLQPALTDSVAAIRRTIAARLDERLNSRQPSAALLTHSMIPVGVANSVWKKRQGMMALAEVMHSGYKDSGRSAC